MDRTLPRHVNVASQDRGRCCPKQVDDDGMRYTDRLPTVPTYGSIWIRMERNLNAKSTSFPLRHLLHKTPVLFLAFFLCGLFLFTYLISNPAKAELVLGGGGSHMQGRKKEGGATWCGTAVFRLRAPLIICSSRKPLPFHASESNFVYRAVHQQRWAGGQILPTRYTTTTMHKGLLPKRGGRARRFWLSH